MRLLLLPLLVISFSGADDRSYECNRIFEARKDELIIELNRIDEKQQALEVMQAATQKVLDKREIHLDKREAKINEKLAKIKALKEEIEAKLQEDKQILESIEKRKTIKVIELYAKMKAGAAAAAIEAMNVDHGAMILYQLAPKQASKIIAKMAPEKAASMTERIMKGPPFKLDSEE